MKCPHCLVEIYPNSKRVGIGTDKDGSWYIEVTQCPGCNKNSYYLVCYELRTNPGGTSKEVTKSTNLIYPKGTNRYPVPLEVPADFSKDYIQSCLVLSDSPMASAALSRRCLQHILRDKLKIKKSDLAKEIQEVIDNALLPADLLESIDAIRNIGNFAAHPIKSQSSGEIVDVEPGEAEWNLDVLEMLFDYLFVRPEIVKKKKLALNAKLSDAGKPNMK
ncbi:MAG: DUF4145 domain-containing protein [Bacteroidales bacterium]|jgi:hypothetical protein|nr:DUF4145 domain-containing protein [Bacteroidales bacterium]